MKMYSTKVHTFSLLLILGALNLSRAAPGNVQNITKEEVSECKSQVCIDAATNILEKLNPNADPCDDFYKFACGKYVEETVIPNDKSTVTIYSGLEKTMQEQLKTSIESGITQKDPRTFHLLKSFYDVCMNTDQTDKTSENDFHNILKDLGGWPVIEGQSWDKSNFDWTNLVPKLKAKGFSVGYFFDFGVQVDEKNNSRYLIHIDQASTGLSRTYLLRDSEDKLLQAHKKYIVDLAEIFGANRKDAAKEITDALNFEIALAKISLPADERRDSTKMYNVMTIEQLESKYPAIPWITYFNNILAPYAQVTATDEVVVAVPSFFDDFSKLITKTPKHVLANYASYRVALESASYLSERVRRATDAFNAVYSGTSARKSRWQECITYITNYSSNRFEIAIGALYARRHFDKKAKTEVTELIENIRKSFHRMITQVTWMAKETREAALEKLNQVIAFAAYPEEYLDDQKIDNYYKNLQVYPESYLKSHLGLKLFHIGREFGKLHGTSQRGDWTTHNWVAVVNAAYQPTDNTIQIPAGILQGEFFTSGKPKYLNFAAIGRTIGHELTHGLDDEGSQFDAIGNLFDWWDPETKKEYVERSQCVIDQYSNYYVEEVGLYLNGKTTLGENIADCGGVKESYYAYEEWEKQNGVEPRLPGLPYNSRQMFWISYGNTKCATYRDEYLKNMILTDPHAPGQFRTIGPLANMPEFSKDFNCPLGSKMNPVKKCTVW